jgi:integrase
MFRRMTRERFLSDAELEAFMAAVRGRRHKHQPRDHALFALLANTGIRPSEALSLTRNVVHVFTQPAWIRVVRLKKQKTAQEFDDIELTTELSAMLRRHIENAPIEHGQRLFPMTRRQAQRLFHYYARLAGIVRKTHLYILRHTAATRIYRATRDIKTVQALLGHESADTSAIYAHISRPALSELADSFPVVV